MIILVTGAAGRLGSVVCRELTAAGHEVIATDMADGHDPGVPVRRVNLLDAAAVRRSLAGAEAVVHLAAHSKYGHIPHATIYGENVTINYNITRLVADTGMRRIIFASSVHVFSGESETGAPQFPSPPAYVPADADLPVIPRNPYGLSKEAGEQMLRYLHRTHGVDGVAIRYPLLLTENSEQWKDFWRPNEFFAWLTFRDASSLIVAILGRDLPGFRIYFPASTQPLNGRPLEENLRLHFAGVPRRVPEGTITALVDTSVITRETGWQPT